MVNSENMGHLDHEVAGGQRTSRRRAAQFSPWIASVSETSVPSNAQGAIGVAPNDFAEHLGGLEWFFLLVRAASYFGSRSVFHSSYRSYMISYKMRAPSRKGGYAHYETQAFSGIVKSA
jgi:hypothetical protein